MFSQCAAGWLGTEPSIDYPMRASTQIGSAPTPAKRVPASACACAPVPLRAPGHLRVPVLQIRRVLLRSRSRR